MTQSKEADASDKRGSDAAKVAPARRGATSVQGARPRSQAADAYAHLRGQILSLEMAPGSTFTEGQVAASLETSKTPVREALVRLEHDRLVKSMPRSGYQVTPITLIETRELSELRGILMVEIAGRVAEANGLTPDDQAHMSSLIEQNDARGQDVDTVQMAIEMADLHREIDMIIVRALGNQNLTSTLEQIFDGLHRARVLSGRLQKRIVAESHARSVMEAIVGRDVETARQAMRERVERGQQLLLTSLIESSSLMSASINELP